MSVRIAPDHNAATALALLFALIAAPASAADPPTDAWVTLGRAETPSDVIGPNVGWSEGDRWRAGVHEVRIFASPTGLGRLAREGRTVTPVPHLVPDGYHTPDQVTDALVALDNRGGRTGVVTLGASTAGRPLVALWAGQPPSAGAPALRVLGAHHGDEASSWEVALDLASTLVNGDGADPAITALLDDATVWVMPLVNPDGAVRQRRLSATGTDLNRNYSYAWDPTAFGGGPAPFSEPETRAVRDAALLSPPHASLSLHAGATNIGYVWNYTFDAAADTPAARTLAATYADHVPDPDFWTTNGASWYRTTGDTNDWSYGQYGGLDFTVEVTQDKSPPAATLPGVLADHRAAQVAFLTAHPSIQGEVIDAETGAPLAATITAFSGLDAASMPFTTHPTSGRFARHLNPNVTQLRVQANGYETQWVPTAAATYPIALAPSSLHAPLAPPQVVIAGASVAVPAAAGPVVKLSRPGWELTVPVAMGHAVVPPQAPPGPYDLVGPSGDTWRNQWLIVGGGAAVFQDLALQTTPDGAVQATVTGEHFGLGARAWVIVPPNRQLVPVALTATSDSSLTVDLTQVDDPLTLWVVANGTHGAWPLTNPVPPPPSRDSGEPFRLERGGCSCSTTATPTGGLWALLLIPPFVVSRRRR